MMRRRLRAAEWQNSEIISGDVAQKLTWPGSSRPHEPRFPLELPSGETFRTGVLNLSYGPVVD